MKAFKNLLGIVLIACLMLAFVACNTDTNTQNTETKDTTTQNAETFTASTAPVEDTADDTADDTTDETAVGFKVTVTDADGTPVEGVVLQICKDTCIPAVTDADGVASFNIEVTSEHKLAVLSLPEGYEYTGEAEVYLAEGMTETTVTVNKVA